MTGRLLEIEGCGANLNYSLFCCLKRRAVVLVHLIVLPCVATEDTLRFPRAAYCTSTPVRTCAWQAAETEYVAAPFMLCGCASDLRAAACLLCVGIHQQALLLQSLVHWVL